MLHGTLIVSELSGPPARGREWQVFLFEQNIIFSEAVGKKTQFTSPAYVYKAHIQVRNIIFPRGIRRLISSPWNNDSVVKGENVIEQV